MLPPLDLGLPGRVRVVLGPQDDHFTPVGLRTLLESVYTVSQASDRMGMRLEGPQLEHSSKGYNIVSDGIAPGSIQVPGNGLPIVLLADRQTTGGYPKIAHRHLRRHPRAGPLDARRKDSLRGGGHRGCRGRGPAARLRHRGHGAERRARAAQASDRRDAG